MSQPNLRALAASVVIQVIDQGHSLSQALPKAQSKLRDARDKALLAEIAYGVMRQLPQLDTQLRRCLQKPLSGKKRIIHGLLLAGLYQLKHTRVGSHAVVAESVNACREIGAPGMTGLVNGVLRALDRDMDALQAEQFDAPSVHYRHPGWFIKRLQQAYPDQWTAILDANNEAPPLWLRNNALQQSRDAYLQQLADAGVEAVAGEEPEAIRLPKPRDVTGLPGFPKGAVSVQDHSAQISGRLLNAQPGERVLDACAAPGGKSCHILEQQPQLAELVALDVDPWRLTRVQQNLDRLGLTATLKCGDGTDPQSWWDGQAFDRILLDAPCSATGVIRRNPDSKWLRRDEDIAQLAELQGKILRACWQMLKPGGTLVYATCSVLPDENVQQIQAFLQNTPDAMLDPIVAGEDDTTPGWQLLPTVERGDGFYYARLIKRQDGATQTA
ncbi:16S rRNA (cytosine(967)-C(5))-methyltransferase RsmB [Ferrimonas balearica]|uniref:16S rRNA (cytosine(967)-C(5))-methyltransferase RsmB n=1 Tax=Ferrimonas balearica TaxID=44012 RepID=UPI001C585185|nr:16S rRNA (cytosine(967)-C(5))-methyltransferase RsmB [Ferrimonas balearica]MBW3141684.1 16S rRNA (cytosine(967)-C(5))-methyltransferase RsmB [Ferrimonas balearica]MBY6108760.1 16S rRNA (cytosine(967)-C(5))-methyltransferase RsmB [Ferrimonas balearica]